MKYLYEVILNFWGFFFGGADYATTLSPNLLNIIEFLGVVTTIAVVMNVLITPLFGLMPWNKRGDR